jgi:hypothetical protein
MDCNLPFCFAHRQPEDLMPRNEHDRNPERKQGVPDPDREREFERDMERPEHGQKGKQRSDDSGSTERPGKHDRDRGDSPERERQPSRR